MAKRILISGAGVAGPALAHWLHRYGFRTTVVERAPAPRDGGYAVDFRGAVHLAVLERMGLLADVRRAATEMGAMAFVDARGRQTASMPADVFSGDVEILRGDLTRILYDATRSHSEYVFGDSIASLTQHDDRVDVTFESGGQRAFDLVVGADGQNSVVRALVWGDDARYLHHLGYYVAIFTTPNHLRLDHTGRFHSVPGRLAGMYSSRGNTEAKAMFYFASEPLRYDRYDVRAQKALLAEAFAGVDWEVPRLLESMWTAPDFYFDPLAQVHLERWSRGRVVLLGDAGYAASPGGNGTGTAIVGAYILAGELAADAVAGGGAAGTGHAGAFARYEERMRAYVQRNQKQAAGGRGFLVPDSRTKIWLRDLMFRSLPYAPWKGLIPRMARRTAEAIDLPEYPNCKLLQER